MIFVIDDDIVMAKLISKATNLFDVQIFTNAIDAMNAIAGGVLPDLIFLDVLLDGPDGFTFLNEMVSYTDTVKIPVVVVSSLDLTQKNLEEYGVVGVLAKEKMYPEEIKEYVSRYAK